MLLRTVWSVINRSPRHLLREILLVDDASDRGKKQQNGLDIFLCFNFLCFSVSHIMENVQIF